MWFVYLLFFETLLGQRAVSIFTPDQPQFFYYHVLIIMNMVAGKFPWAYVWMVLSILTNAFVLILIWLYAIRRFFFSSSFIIFFLVLKLAADIFGHSYEWVLVRSLFFQSLESGWLGLTDHVVWLIPSYIAILDYLGKKLKSGNRG